MADQTVIRKVVVNFTHATAPESQLLAAINATLYPDLEALISAALPLDVTNHRFQRRVNPLWRQRGTDWELYSKLVVTVETTRSAEELEVLFDGFVESWKDEIEAFVVKEGGTVVSFLYKDSTIGRVKG